MDSRQSMSMMGPPGYPHMPPMSTTGPTMPGDRSRGIKPLFKPVPAVLTQVSPPCVPSPGHHAQMNQQHMIPSRNFQMHRMPADDIQDEFDWDSIV